MNGGSSSYIERNSFEAPVSNARLCTQRQSGADYLQPASPEHPDVPLAQRKGKREIRLPARYRQDDILPQPLPHVNCAEVADAVQDGACHCPRSQEGKH